jgi:hypothetical protein
MRRLTFISQTPDGQAEDMFIVASGLPANTGFDFFVIQVPNSPFGLRPGVWLVSRRRSWSGGHCHTAAPVMSTQLAGLLPTTQKIGFPTVTSYKRNGGQLTLPGT